MARWTRSFSTLSLFARALVLIHLSLPAGAQPAQSLDGPFPIYLDPSQPIDARVADLVSRMTFEEKAAQLFHGAGPNPRLQIPAFGGWNQCLHGVWSTRSTTLFPVPIALASTWDPDLIHTVADAISDEARALYNIGATGPRGRHGLIYRAPVINISRDPRWGRIQECYGEDPFLTSRIGVAYVQGLQGSDPNYLKLASTLKHFAVNNQENGRMSLSASVSERWLHEYWLPHFKACVTEGQAQSLMAAYNAINGAPCAINRLLLTDILRDSWGFNGFVVSDLGGIGFLVTSHHAFPTNEQAVAAAISAGCDLDDNEYTNGLPGAVQQGLLSEDAVDLALARYLRVAFRLGAFDPPEMVPYSAIPESVIHSPEHRQLSLQTARASIVLLSNRDNFLPLDGTTLNSVAVIGPMANHFEAGSYFGTPSGPVNPLQGIQNRADPTTQVLYAKGCEITAACNPADLAQAIQFAGQADVAVLYLGTNNQVEAEGRDRTQLGLPGGQEQLLQAVYQANPRTAVVLINGGPLSVRWARDNVPAIVEAYYAGEEGGNAIADVLFGNSNPGAKLAYTVYESTAQIPPQSEYDISRGFTYMYFQGEPVFPFGHGLSYTQFEYGRVHLSHRHVSTDGRLRVRIDVRNVGQRSGAEVVQLYAHRTSPIGVPVPIKKLVGFRKIQLEAGEQATVRFELPADQLAIYDEARHDFVVEPGVFQALVGSSSEDIRARAHFLVTASRNQKR